MSVRPEVIAANTAYAENFGSKGTLALPPRPSVCHLDLHGCPP
jgi:hypothetical protein